MIDLNEHKYFDYERKIEAVPFSIVLKVLEELRDQFDKELDEAMDKITDSLTEINKTIEDND
jgi:hypothetical protein